MSEHIDTDEPTDEPETRERVDPDVEWRDYSELEETDA